MLEIKKTNWTMISVISMFVMQFALIIWHVAMSSAALEVNTQAIIELRSTLRDMTHRSASVDSMINARQQANMYRIDRLEDRVHLTRITVP